MYRRGGAGNQAKFRKRFLSGLPPGRTVADEPESRITTFGMDCVVRTVDPFLSVTPTESLENKC